MISYYKKYYFYVYDERFEKFCNSKDLILFKNKFIRQNTFVELNSIIMKKIFPGFNRYSESEIKTLWDAGTICFDANVLLNLYRYSDETRNTLLDLINKFKNKIWLPHQAALEYNRNRYEVISDQEKAYKDFKDKISQIQNDLQSTSKPPFLTNSVLSSLKEILDQVDKEVEGSLKKYSDFLKDDPIYEKLSELFEGRISNPFSEERLREIYKDGETRYNNKIPPGYEDEKDKKGERKFGDLILWKQLIEKAKENNPIILITDERKIDWWWKLKDGRIMGPRQELVEEIATEANVNFHMYSSERFLSYGLNYLQEQINKKAFDEIKEMKRDEHNEFIRLKNREKIFNQLVIQNIEELKAIESKIQELTYAKASLHTQLNNLDFLGQDIQHIKNEYLMLTKQLNELHSLKEKLIYSMNYGDSLERTKENYKLGLINDKENYNSHEVS